MPLQHVYYIQINMAVPRGSVFLVVCIFAAYSQILQLSQAYYYPARQPSPAYYGQPSPAYYGQPSPAYYVQPSPRHSAPSCRESIEDLAALSQLANSLNHVDKKCTCKTCGRTFDEDLIVKLVDALVATATKSCYNGNEDGGEHKSCYSETNGGKPKDNGNEIIGENSDDNTNTGVAENTASEDNIVIVQDTVGSVTGKNTKDLDTDKIVAALSDLDGGSTLNPDVGDTQVDGVNVSKEVDG